MKLLSVILSLFTILTITSSINGENFNKNIVEAYDEYVYLANEETVYGDFALVFGTYKNKYYISCYLFSYTQNDKIYLRVRQDSKLYTFVPDSYVVEAYGQKIESSDFSVYYYLNNQEIKAKDINFQEALTLLQTNPLKGNSKGDFPGNKIEISLMLKLIIIIAIIGVLMVAFAIILVILYRKRYGRFKMDNVYISENNEFIDATYEYENPNDEESFEKYRKEHEENIQPEPNFTKTQIIDRLFEEYRSGEITEEELDERLKSLEGEK